MFRELIALALLLGMGEPAKVQDGTVYLMATGTGTGVPTPDPKANATHITTTCKRAFKCPDDTAYRTNNGSPQTCRMIYHGSKRTANNCVLAYCCANGVWSTCKAADVECPEGTFLTATSTGDGSKNCLVKLNRRIAEKVALCVAAYCCTATNPAKAISCEKALDCQVYKTTSAGKALSCVLDSKAKNACTVLRCCDVF